MQIDWITVVAQVINFLVLVWLLRHFLYRPVMDTMARREDRIRGRLEAAEQREREAAECREHYERRTAEFDERRDALLDDAREDAERRRKALLEEARDAADEARAEWRERAEQDRAASEREVRRETAGAVRHVAERALDALAGAELEAQVIERFLERLKALDEDTRERFAREADGAVVVRSANRLDGAVRGRITRAVHERLGRDLEVGYDEDAELLCGVELGAGGLRLGWSIADFLAALDRELATAPAARDAAP